MLWTKFSLILVLCSLFSSCVPLTKRSDATDTVSSGLSAAVLSPCTGFTAFQENYSALVPSSCTGCHSGGSGGLTLTPGTEDSVIAANYLAIRKRIKAQDGSEISAISDSYFYNKISGGTSHQGGAASQDMQAAVAAWIPADLTQTCVINEAAGTVAP